MYIFWYLYFSLIGLAFYYKSIVYVAFLIFFGIAIIIIGKILKKQKVNELRLYVQLLKEKKTKKQDIEVNVNKTDWEFIKELPGFDRVKAKKVVWIRRKIGKYNSLEDFFIKNNVDEEYKKILKKLVVIK